jgi:sulfur carrier protein
MSQPTRLSVARLARYPAAMDLVVNGERRSLDVTTVDTVVLALGLPPERVAVELNGAIVTKAKRAETSVKDGDVLEVVTLVGGG